MGHIDSEFPGQLLAEHLHSLCNQHTGNEIKCRTIKCVGFQLHDDNTTLVEHTETEESFNTNKNIIYPIMKKVTKIGDTPPDLISDEVPPLAILEFAESELHLLGKGTTSSAPTRGEGTDLVVNPPQTSAADESSFSTEKPISVETSSQGDDDGDAATDSYECTTVASCIRLVPPPTSPPPVASKIPIPNNHREGSSIFSSRQSQMITSTADNENGKKFVQIVQQEQGNDVHAKSTAPSLTDMNNMETTRGVSIQEHVTKHAIIFEDNEPSSTTTTTTTASSNSNRTHGQLESGAVTAPEGERHVETDSVIAEESVSTTATDNIITEESINLDKSYDAGVPLSQQQQQQQQLQDVKSAFAENEDHTDSTTPPEAAMEMKCTNSSLASSSAAGVRDLSSAIITRSRKVEKEKSRSKSKRKQSNSASRNSGKSPIRVVEVYDRTTPVSMKPTKPGRPVSPYQCKVFPIPENIKSGQSSSFTVNSKQCKVLDKELARGLEREKRVLVDALTEYFKNENQTNTAAVSLSSSSYAPDVDENESIIANGTQRETFMSWVIKGQHREEGENSDEYWNPITNVFRTSACTQVSSPPSFTEKPQATSEQAITNSTSQSKKSPNPKSKIRLVGQHMDGDILNTGRTMYTSLKSLQKAIHLSDLFCFRNNVPDLPLGESLSQPKFQQFMESENEIEILENIVSLLGSAKDDVETYLQSLQKAHLVTVDYSKKLSKTEIGNNNELNDEDKDKKDGTIGGAKVDPDSTEQEIVLFTCPSCNSQMDLEISHPTQNTEISRERLLPQIYTFLEENGKVTLSTYYTLESKSLVHTTLCDGHIYQTHFAATDSAGPLQGITRAKKEYLGQPSHLSLEILLSTIHRCASYIDTRIACSCVWSRQSKHYLCELIESYLEKQYIPSTSMGRWTLYRMKRKLKQINVFAGIVRSFSEELVQAVDKIHFCMQKSQLLLSKNLTEPELPGFGINSTNSSWDDIKAAFSSTNMYITPKCSNQDNCGEMSIGSRAVECLYEKLKRAMSNKETADTREENEISVLVLVQIATLATNDIETTADFADHYAKMLQMPGKKARRVLKFMSITLSQMGFSKDVQFGSLLATFLSVVDKLSIFEEFMCEQKYEIRARIHKMCSKIIRKLSELRGNLYTQMNWSSNLANKSLMRIREINEIKRIKTEKKMDKHMNTEIEFLRGSDGSLRTAVC